jgi:hypothetical protein
MLMLCTPWVADRRDWIAFATAKLKDEMNANKIAVVYENLGFD